MSKLFSTDFAGRNYLPQGGLCRGAGGRRRPGDIRGYGGSGDRRFLKNDTGRGRFSAPDRGLSGNDLCRGKDPRRLFQAGRTSQRKGDPDLADHRPLHPPPVSEELFSRNPAHGVGPFRGQRERLRCGGDAGRIRGARDLGHPLQGTDRRGPGRPRGRRFCLQPLAGASGKKRSQPLPRGTEDRPRHGGEGLRRQPRHDGRRVE